jgi:hypothetical protein
MDGQEFEVISLDKTFYMKPDEYLNGWAKKCGWKATLVYDSLWRHADRSRESFPSIKLMSDEHGVSTDTIKRGIRTLESFGIISREQKTDPITGKFKHNTYVLLAKKHWKEPTVGADSTTVNRGAVVTPTVGADSTPKDTHKKDTHISTTNVVLGKPEFGNQDVNEVLEYTKQKLQLPGLDGSERTNRRYAWNLIKASKTGLVGVKWLIDQAAGDDWWKNHTTSIRDIWNNKLKIVSSRNGGQKMYVAS